MRYLSHGLVVLILTAPAALACPFETSPDSVLRFGAGSPLSAIRTCAEAGFDFSAPLADGRVPFREIVVSRSDPEAVELMLQAGADPNTSDKYGSPAFVDAINFVHDREHPDFLRMIEILGAYGADFSRPDSHGDLALSKAAGGDDNRLLAILLEHGADPNGLNTYDRTPLFETVFGTCNTEGGAMLIDAGATLSSMPADQVERLFDEAQASCSGGVEGQAFIDLLKGLHP